jgi:hypothetical protein
MGSYSDKFLSYDTAASYSTVPSPQTTTSMRVLCCTVLYCTAHSIAPACTYHGHWCILSSLPLDGRTCCLIDLWQILMYFLGELGVQYMVLARRRRQEWAGRGMWCSVSYSWVYTSAHAVHTV